MAERGEKGLRIDRCLQGALADP